MVGLFKACQNHSLRPSGSTKINQLCIGTFQPQEEARQAYASLCEDPWYKNDGTVKGIELVQASDEGVQRLDWYALNSRE